MQASETLQDALARVYAGRPWLIALDVLQGATPTAATLRGWGADRCFVIAAREGVGAPPLPEDAEVRVLGLAPMDMMGAIHAAEQALRDLPDEVQAAVDAFDPSNQMQVLGAIFSDGRPVAGRRFFGARPPAWQALEDKTVIDAVWDAAGVPRAPCEVVEVELASLTAAAARLDRGAGTVWAGDATGGFHGGASYTLPVRSVDDAESATARLRQRCRTARVMPYLVGIPCSIHAVVFPDHVVVLRPAEMVVLRSPSGFRYARAATFWDPPASDREALRSAARRVGEYLRTHVGYRGALTIDGVMTEEGFRPTELNPRVGAALPMMARGFPFSLLNAAMIEGVDLPVADLEDEWVGLADAHRVGSFAMLVDEVLQAAPPAELSWRRDRWERTPDGQLPDAVLHQGPGPTGGYLSLQLVSERTPVGPSVAPRAAALARWLDANLGTSIGPLEAATDVTGPERSRAD